MDVSARAEIASMVTASAPTSAHSSPAARAIRSSLSCERRWVGTRRMDAGVRRAGSAIDGVEKEDGARGRTERTASRFQLTT
jgi:hypothetical protein